jgi:hypothetical protein
MKHLICILLLSFTILSCKKTEVLDFAENPSTYDATSEFENAPKNMKRHLFNLLTPEEKLKVWNQNLGNYISQTTSPEKKEAILVLKSYLKLEIFAEKENLARATFLNQTLPEWRKKSQSIFTVDDFMELNNLPLNKKGEQTSLNTIKNAKVSTSNCDCTRNNVYDCSNTAGTLRCAKTRCGESNFGCGDFWLQNCNGLCSYTPIEQ